MKRLLDSRRPDFFRPEYDPLETLLTEMFVDAVLANNIKEGIR